jgi:hypothetical protein
MPTPLTCSGPDCGQDFTETLRSVRPGEVPEANSIILCGYCGTVNFVNDDLKSLRQASPVDLLLLKDDDRNDLDFAVRVIKSKLEQERNRRN